ncbi:hypothetical protein PRZ48_003055 [Zasmidium cellare]|uniref:Uncharacterized protein n=1 Tax=Zasmidium cellare TaxID=395010 RepID=A0ABR0EU34_ZASCE|nr:hypothetical protein PRZ48_003055 [Zasmidium cellare]
MANIPGKEKASSASSGFFCGGLKELFGVLEERKKKEKEGNWTLDTSPSSVQPQAAPVPAAAFPVIVRYGHLNEGTHPIPTLDKPAFKRRYLARRSLADLAHCPEGFEFQHRLDGQPPQAVILLSPPNIVATCNNHGQWERRMREARDGPEPYTPEWYIEYLRKSNLPMWFMSAGHVSMLYNNLEAQMLGVAFTDLPPARQVPLDYLAVRYPTLPQFPELVGVGHFQVYQYALSEHEQLNLARKFPATNMLGPNTRVLIKPGGYITMHHNPSASGCPVLNTYNLRWSRSAASRASYLKEMPDTVSFSGLFSPNTSNRNGLAAIRTRNGGFVNPTECPPGQGAWEWLDPRIDQQAAQVLGFQEPSDVAVAVQRGHLRTGRGEYDAPIVVWQPDIRYFNPDSEPTEPGLWEFYNDASRQKARDEFGGQDVYGLLESPDPSAYEIWQIRQLFKLSAADHDPTAEIDLVWAFKSSDDEAEVEAAGALVAATQQEGEASTPQVQAPIPAEVDAGYGVDRGTGLAHDPSNGGENDQTASDGRAAYSTRSILGKKITLDRARVHAVPAGTTPQVHRMWTYTAGGRWLRYPETGGKINWADKASVEKLNKWRQQAEKRNGWAPKRALPREQYTNAQRAWVFRFVAENNGGRPRQGGAELCRQFNAEFGAQRKQKAVEALVDRLMREWKENGGEMKARVERAPKKRKTAAGAARVEVESEEEDAPHEVVSDVE